jgi:hypothetical protein
MNLFFSSAGCSLLRAEGFFCSLDILYTGFRDKYIKSFDQKKIYKFSAVFFFYFLSSKPWIRIRIRIRIHLKCWIRIHILIRIQ